MPCNHSRPWHEIHYLHFFISIVLSFSKKKNIYLLRAYFTIKEILKFEKLPNFYDI